MKKFLIVVGCGIGLFLYAGSDMARSHKAKATEVLKTQSVAAANSASAALRQ